MPGLPRTDIEETAQGESAGGAVYGMPGNQERGHGKEWLEWLKVLAPIVTLFVSALLTIAGYFAKKTIDGYGQRISAGETRSGG